MSKKRHKILAIDPGMRMMGVAFLEGDSIIYHGVKMIPRKKIPHETLREGRKIILRLINGLRPRILVVEKTFFANNRNMAFLNDFVKQIQMIGRRKGLRVLAYAPNTVKKCICGDGRASKEEVARAVIARYPELKVYLTQDRKWKERYHQNMFDAIGLALVCSQKIDVI